MIAGLDHLQLAKYESYWLRLTPDGVRESYLRWMFAFASVNTGWAQNVALYRAWSALPYNADVSQFEAAVHASRAGLYKRAAHASEFAKAYWANPTPFMPSPGESLADVRARVIETMKHRGLKGIGLAKISFALELLKPGSCDVVCIDRHVARWFGVETRNAVGTNEPVSMSDELYYRIETAWLDLCKKYKKPSPILRHALWDSVQGQPDTRYWSYCLEP